MTMNVELLLKSPTTFPEESPIRRAFIRALWQEQPEARMWRDVVAQAVLEAFGIVRAAPAASYFLGGKTRIEKATAEYIYVVQEARKWFRTSAAKDVCSLAGVDYAPLAESITLLPVVKFPRKKLHPNEVKKFAMELSGAYA